MSVPVPALGMYLSLAVRAGLVIAKLWVSTITGSAVVLAEAIRSIIDLSSQALALTGLAHPTAAAQSGERAFWALVVPILLFALGAGIATWEGVDRLSRPRGIVDPLAAYIVLGVALLVQSWLAWSAMREARKGAAGDPVAMAGRIVAGVGMACSGVAMAGLAAADLGGLSGADGAAAVAVGLGLALVAAAMAIEVRWLLAAARPATPAVAIERQAQDDAATAAGPPPLTPALAKSESPEPRRPDGGPRRKGKRRRR